MGGSAIGKRRRRCDANGKHDNRGCNQLEHSPLLSLAFVSFSGTFRHFLRISYRRDHPNARSTLLGIRHVENRLAWHAGGVRRPLINLLGSNIVDLKHDHFRGRAKRAARRAGIATLLQSDLLTIQHHDWDPLAVSVEEPGILRDVYVIDAKNEFRWRCFRIAIALSHREHSGFPYTTYPNDPRRSPLTSVTPPLFYVIWRARQDSNLRPAAMSQPGGRRQVPQCVG